MPTEPAATARPTSSNHRIVVGVDGSENSMKALEWAAVEADHTHAVLDIETAYEPGYVFISREEVTESMERIVEEAAARVAELAPGVTTKGGLHEASPAKALIETSEGADLLVVGSRGLGGFMGLLLGSVSQQCLLHAHCSVTVIR